MIWDTSTWAVVHILPTPAAHVLALAWLQPHGGGAGGGHVLTAGTWEGQMLVWEGEEEVGSTPGAALAGEL